MLFWIIFIVVAFAIVFILLYNVFVRKYKSNEPKKLTTAPKEEKTKEEEKPEIPEILEEVTRGNYMYDISYTDESEELEMNMVENKNIQPKKEEYKGIQLEGEMQEEALTTQDILDELDGNTNDKSSLNKEISNLSPTMKAILISNLLEKKNKF